MSRIHNQAPLALALLAATCLTPVNHVRAAPGAEFQVNTFTAGDQLNPVVAAAPDGRFVVVWEGASLSDNSGVSAQLYDAAGRPLGGEFRVNATVDSISGTQDGGVSVAMDADGDFVVVWNGDDPSDNFGIFAQRFDAAGFPLGLSSASTPRPRALRPIRKSP